MLTAFPQGISSFGGAVLPSPVAGAPGAPIRGWAGAWQDQQSVIWVNSAAASNGDGTSPDNALVAVFGATGALAKLGERTNSGALILVMPGHSENVSAADMASHTGAASGFSIVGLGTGTMRPLFTWTATGSTWLIDTANVEIANCRLYLAAASGTPTITIVTPITVSAAGFRLVGCYVNWGWDTNTGCGSTLGAIAFTTAADDCEILNNFFDNQDVAGTLAITCLSINGADRIRIVGNQFTGGTTATTVGPIHFLTTLSANVVIAHNYIENLKASSTKALSSAIAGVTGTVHENMFRVQSGIVAATIAVTPLLCSFFRNWTSDTDTLDGALDVAGGTST